MAGLIEPASELQRLDKRLQKIEQELANTRAKLANDNFVHNAPAEVVAQERARLAERERERARAAAPDRAGARTDAAASARFWTGWRPGGCLNRLDDSLAAIERVILGKGRQVRLCLTCLLARGHLLIEDVPGVGKTTLAHCLARVLGLEWTRLQFTSDMLPADIIGVSIFDRDTHKFQFRRGPVFTQLLLADEVNRASPKAQSALLEAMEERQVSVDGVTYPLPEPFFVVATQNPHEQVGTYGLPESQLDRFLMRVSLGYPDRGLGTPRAAAGRAARAAERHAGACSAAPKC